MHKNNNKKAIESKCSKYHPKWTIFKIGVMQTRVKQHKVNLYRYRLVYCCYRYCCSHCLVCLSIAEHVSHLENVSEEEINRLLGMVVDVENLFMSVHKEEDTDTKQVYFYLFKVNRKTRYASFIYLKCKHTQDELLTCTKSSKMFFCCFQIKMSHFWYGDALLLF